MKSRKVSAKAPPQAGGTAKARGAGLDGAASGAKPPRAARAKAGAGEEHPAEPAAPASAAPLTPVSTAAPASLAPESAVGMDLTPVVAQNLKRLRTERGLSLERLSQSAGVSRAMLGQIEQSKSAPTINVLWKIVRALDVPFSTLISDPSAARVTIVQASRARMLRSRDGTFSSRALFPMDQPRNVEFYELRLAAFGTEHADAHPAGTTENIVVNSGSLELTVGAERALLVQGDAILFQADVPHVYRNPGNAEAVLYLVMTYPRLS